MEPDSDTEDRAIWGSPGPGDARFALGLCLAIVACFLALWLATSRG